MKNAVFCDVARCRSCVNRRFGGTSTLTMESIRSSETSVHTRSTLRYIPEDGILHLFCCSSDNALGFPRELVCWCAQNESKLRPLPQNPKYTVRRCGKVGG
jgi:hypothetical protein